MLQLEVVERLLAAPSTKEYGVLTVLVRLSADVEDLLTLPAGAFRPMPKVRSGLVRLHFHPPDPSPANRDEFAKMVTAVFTRRRKTIENALQAFRPGSRRDVTAVLDAARIAPQRRPETLDLAEFVRLSDALSPSLQL